MLLRRSLTTVATTRASSNLASLLLTGIQQGHRASLAKAITMVESTRQDHKLETQRLLSLILNSHEAQGTFNTPSTITTTPTTITPHAKNPYSLRIGLSGAPGVGKSSFIETFGMHLLNLNHKVAVLAVDPSSSRTGGSILGDKTRMTELSRQDKAFVRPSPSRGTMGGVARNTNEAILLCEAAGYDIILVETVGVGQSETMVADMVDMFVLLVAPGHGDELQGIKRGIVELADMIIVNKSDGVLEAPARMAQMEYTSALKFMPPIYSQWKPKVIRVSSEQKMGIDEAWKIMLDFQSTLVSANEIEAKRGRQRMKWMWARITDELMWRLRNDSKVKHLLESLEGEVYDGRMTPGQAADQVLELL